MFSFRTGSAILFSLCLMSMTPKNVCAERKIPQAVVEHHIKKMKQLYPERFRELEKSSGGNVLDCLGCHKIKGNKKSHSHIQVPDTPGTTSQ